MDSLPECACQLLNPQLEALVCSEYKEHKGLSIISIIL